MFGPLDVRAAPIDTDFGVSGPGLRLIRKVEMYQWTERALQSRGGSEKTYALNWAETSQKSSAFKTPEGHLNPPMPFESRSFVSPAVFLGAHRVESAQLAAFGQARALPPDEPTRAALAAALGRQVFALESGYFVGEDPLKPHVGDLRLSYRSAAPAAVTLVAAQTGSGLAAFPTRAGPDLFLAREGERSASAIFAEEASGAGLFAWSGRFLGVLFVFAGLRIVLGVVVDLSRSAPVFPGRAGAHMGALATVIAASLSLSALALIWLAARPLVGLVLIGLAGLAVMALKRPGAKLRR